MPPDSQQAPNWDIFLSYSRGADAAPASVLAAALRDRGLRVFWDDHDVRPFEGISRSILRALSRSRVLLAYFSIAYPLRRACQHELTTAFLAGQQEGDPARRVLVVNPEHDVEHIHPIQLRDARHARAPRSRSELAGLVDAVQRHVAEVDRDIGDIEPVTPPLWLPAPAQPRPARFANRSADLWALHSALHVDDTPMTAHPHPVAVIHGPPGIGKSALVAEYAHRFGAALPGGIFWFDGTAEPFPLREQFAAVAKSITGRSTAPTDAIASMLHSRGQRALWVLDNVPPGLHLDLVRQAAGPHPLARCVLTSRDVRYTELGHPLAVHGLPKPDAQTLLDTSDPALAVELADLVGHHPQALMLLNQEQDLTHTAARIAADRPTVLERLAGDYLPGVQKLDLSILDLLFAVAALHPAPVPPTLLNRLGGTHHAISQLAAQGWVHPRAGALTMNPLLAHLIRCYGPDPRRYAKVRARTLRRALATAVTPDDAVVPAPSSTERRLAWKLQVELAHRVSAIPLAVEAGSLRGALSSLHSLFGFTRQLLRDNGPAQAALPRIGATLLATHLRPLLTTWHPELLAHEAREVHPDPIEHERAWAGAPELRRELAALREPLLEVLDDLAVITGSRYGLPSHRWDSEQQTR